MFEEPREEPPRTGDLGRSLLTPAQAAAAAGVSRQSIYEWIRKGRLPAIRIGKQTLRIAPDSLERVIAERSASPSQPRKRRFPARTSHRAATQRPPGEDVVAWIDDFYEHYGRIPPRDEIRQAFDQLTKRDAEQYLRDARTRLWRREP